MLETDIEAGVTGVGVVRGVLIAVGAEAAMLVEKPSAGVLLLDAVESGHCLPS
jgi:hypothetical protein